MHGTYMGFASDELVVSFPGLGVLLVAECLTNSLYFFLFVTYGGRICYV